MSGRVLILLTAVASLGVVVLISLNLAGRSAGPGNPGGASPLQGLHAGTESPDPSHDPPVLGTVPEFSLTERSGRLAGTEQLAGKVWIADFVFTHCAGPCPMMTQRMAGLQQRLAKRPDWSDLRLVSFSVDPQRDTPEALQEYAKSFSADSEHWLFLTGDADTIWKLTKDGFKLPVGNGDDADKTIFHSTRFVLVDRLGRIRGYYEGLEEEGLAKLHRDLDRVMEEKN